MVIEKLTLIAIGGSCGLILLGQSLEKLDPTGITALIASMGSTGVLVWYLWYNVTKSIPRIVDQFRKEMEQERAFHREDLNKVRELVTLMVQSKGPSGPT